MILFLSNGHGEDTVACYLIRTLQELSPGIPVAACPLVGDGLEYHRSGVDVLAAGVHSHGFRFPLLHAAWAVVQRTRRSRVSALMAALQSARGRCDLCVAVGDIVPVLAAYRLAATFLFVGISKSSHYHHAGRRFLAIERRLLRKAVRAYVHDEATAAALRRKGMANAVYAGNPMMDFPASSLASDVRQGARWLVGLAPGSYDDRLGNMRDLVNVVARLRSIAPNDPSAIRFIMTASSDAELDAASGLDIPGWTFVSERDSTKEAGLRGRWTDGRTEIPLYTRWFHALASSCDILIGLAGTANEQAAGMGVPLVSFPARGRVQYTRSFAVAQQQLLGDALMVVHGGPQEVAARVLSLLSSPATLRTMSAAGRERIGPPGAARTIARDILTQFEQRRTTSTNQPS